MHSILPGPSQSVLDGSVEDGLSDKETEIRMDATQDDAVGQRES